MKKFSAVALLLLCTIAWATPIVPDIYDKLFLRCNGSGTTFIDDSTANTKIITANGNATQLPIKFNKSAGFFNGTTDYVVVPASTDFNFTGDFEIDLFVFPTAVNTNFIDSLSNRDWSSATTNDWELYCDGNRYVTFAVKNVGVAGQNADAAIVLNAWNHVIVRRSGSTTSIYLNGTASAITLSSSATFGNTKTAVLGQNITNLNLIYGGWMKELRISNVARTVAVPTAQYTSDANTKLLMHFDTPATSPLGPAISFDGTGDYLSVADHADWDFGTGDFTVEAYINPTVLNADNGLFNTNQDNWAGSGFGAYWHAANARWQLRINSTDMFMAADTIAVNKWFHVAFVRTAGQIKYFLNGVQIGADQASSENISGTGKLTLGVKGSTTYWTGYVREFRVSNSARYTSSFNPSQTGFTVDANTKLYIKGNEDNGVTTFVDSETSPKTITTNGDTKIKYTEDYRSCIFKDETGKFPYPQGSAKVDFFAIGSGVGYFDGTNSYLELADSNDFDWAAPSGSTNDFTWEMYIRNSASSGVFQIISRETVNHKAFNGSLSDGSWQWCLDNSHVVMGGYTASEVIDKTPNIWQHIAMARSGTTLNFFLNGRLAKSVSDSTDYSDTEKLLIGHNYTWYFTGLMDNIRISKGVARYTAAFNPSDDYNNQTVNGQMLEVF